MPERQARCSHGGFRSTAAVIFDLDGVLLDSELVWEQERRAFVAEHAGRWQPDSQRRMMGMSTREWATYLSAELGVALPPPAIVDGVIQRVSRRYARGLPLIAGAARAVERLGARWPLGLASSSPRPVIELVLDRAGLAGRFTATVSSDDVAQGKPAPDVYLEAARRLGLQPGTCVAVEDSGNGLRAASAAGMGVVAIPNAQYPPDAAALALADIVLRRLHDLREQTIETLRVRT